MILNVFYIICFRPFFVKRIAHSNLLLVVVKNAESSQSNLSVNADKIDYKDPMNINTDHSCNKLNINPFYRRKLGGCYNSHPEVKKTIYHYLVYFVLIYLIN